jgi:hypothetical protein
MVVAEKRHEITLLEQGVDDEVAPVAAANSRWSTVIVSVAEKATMRPR